MKTQDLIGPALDWAVAECEQYHPIAHEYSKTAMARREWRPSIDWAQGGPIIERERISAMETDAGSGDWEAFIWLSPDMHMPLIQEGPTPLIAAMRCYVASVLGDTVEIPEAIAC